MIIDFPYKKYNKEAGIYTFIVVATLLCILWFFKLQIPDPPISERGGGPDGKGKMMELAFAPVASETPSVTANSQPEPEKTEEETHEENPVDVPTPVENNSQPVVSDNNSTDEIKVTEKKSNVEATKQTTVSESPAKKEKKKKTKAVNQGDLFDEGENVEGGGDPNGQSTTGTGGDGSGGAASDHDFGKNGWNWSKPPKTDKKSPKNGEIVFNVEIDENGKVSNVSPKRYTVDYELMQSYQEECYKLKFVRKNDITISGSTKGTITFTFKAR